MAQSEHTSAAIRGALATRANPARRVEFVVEHERLLTDGRRLVVRLVPDRLLLCSGAFDAYCTVLGSRTWPDLETLGLAVLADIANELVPRWCCIAVADANGRVVAEDRQPDWDNPALLSRLKPF